MPTNTTTNAEPSSETVEVVSTSNSVPQAPSINKVEFSKKIEINDLKNRYMLTRGPTQAEITEETGAGKNMILLCTMPIVSHFDYLF